MSDAGVGNGAEEDFDDPFSYERARGYNVDVEEGSYDLTGGYEGAGRGVTVAPELGIGGPGLLTGGGEVESPVPVPEVPKVPEKPAKEKKPVITRAKRRRSLLTEEEGGILRKPTVYRRSILGRP